MRLSAVVVVVLLVGTGADFGSRIGRDPTLVDTRLTSESAPTSSTSSAVENSRADGPSQCSTST